MDDAAVRLAITLTPREVVAIRAALRHVQHESAGISELARIELDGGAWLSDPEIDSLIGVLTNQADVFVMLGSGAPVHVDDRAWQLFREAFDYFNDPASKVDLRDWNRKAKKLLRADRSDRDGLPAAADGRGRGPDAIDPRD